MLATIWPHINKAAERIARDSIEPSLQKSVPAFGSSIKLKEFSLGSRPPDVLNVVRLPNNATDVIEIAIDFDFQGQDTNITFSSVIGEMGLKDLKMEGRLGIQISPILNCSPIIGGYHFYFYNVPKIKFDLTGMANIADAPVLSSAIRACVEQQIAAMFCLPHRIFIPFAEIAPWDAVRQMNLPFWGVLKLKVLRARNLAAADYGIFRQASSDPYCIVSVGDVQRRTKTINRNLNPEWNQCFYLEIWDQGQTVSFSVYDEDVGSRDDALGNASLFVAHLMTLDPGEQWIPLTDGSGDICISAEWYGPPSQQQLAAALPSSSSTKRSLLDTDVPDFIQTAPRGMFRVSLEISNPQVHVQNADSIYLEICVDDQKRECVLPLGSSNSDTSPFMQIQHLHSLSFESCIFFKLMKKTKKSATPCEHLSISIHQIVKNPQNYKDYHLKLGEHCHLTLCIEVAVLSLHEQPPASFFAWKRTMTETSNNFGAVINSIIATLWPHITQAAGSKTLAIVENLKPNLPWFAKTLEMKRFDLGLNPIKIDSFVITPMENGEGLQLRAELNYDSLSVIEFTTEDLNFGVSNIAFKASLVIALRPLVSGMPLIGAASFFFLNSPQLTFDLTGIADIGDQPIFSDHLRSGLRELIDGYCVLPNTVFFPMIWEENLTSDLTLAKSSGQKPIGMLRLRVVRAEGVPAADTSLFGMRSSDPYVIVRIGSTKHTTSVQKSTLNPVWEEEFDIMVYEKEQLVEIEVWDKDQLSKDDLLGQARCSVQQLIDEGELWLGLSSTGVLLLEGSWFSFVPEATSSMPSLITLHILRVENLPISTKMVPTGAFVEIVFKGKKYRSRYCHGTTTLRISQNFVLFAPPAGVIEIHVKQCSNPYDTKGEEMGRALLPLGDVLKQQSSQQSEMVETTLQLSTMRGSINIAVSAQGLAQTAGFDPNIREKRREEIRLDFQHSLLSALTSSYNIFTTTVAPTAGFFNRISSFFNRLTKKEDSEVILYAF